jgi:nitroreductase
METLETIGKRASLKRHLAARDIEEEKIALVLDAARMAPSAHNMQPWRFIIVRGKKNIETVVTRAFEEANQIVREAPVLIIACANPGDDMVQDGKGYYLFDTGLAVENMLLAATELGLATHPMIGVDEVELKKVLNIPDEVRFVVATPLAYPAGGSYEEAARERLEQRSRKSREEVVYSDVWGKPF